MLHITRCEDEVTLRSCSIYIAKDGLTTHQPDAAFQQPFIIFRKAFPAEGMIRFVLTCGNQGATTIIPPEPASSFFCTISACIIVISVKSSEFRVVVVNHRVSSVARVSTDLQTILGCLAVHDERAVLSPVPLLIDLRLQVKPRLVPTVLGELVYQFVSEPVIAGRHAEPRLEVFP